MYCVTVINIVGIIVDGTVTICCDVGCGGVCRGKIVSWKPMVMVENYMNMLTNCLLL